MKRVTYKCVSWFQGMIYFARKCETGDVKIEDTQKKERKFHLHLGISDVNGQVAHCLEFCPMSFRWDVSQNVRCQMLDSCENTKLCFPNTRNVTFQLSAQSTML